MRPTTLPAGLDGLRLRAELSAATRDGWAKPANRQLAMTRLKRYLDKGRALADTRLNGAEGGLEAARSWSGVMNAALRALFDSIISDHTEDAIEGIALCALGGYGAGELAPQSDIDLVFLTSDTPPDYAAAVIEQTQYAIWDAGLHIGGGAVRTIDEALALAKDDLSERTALLDLRSISGDIRLVREMHTRFDEEIRIKNDAEFAAAKLAERDERVDRQGDSRYAVEPNIKDGKGALRDLQTLRWLAQILYGDDALERWVVAGLFSIDDVKRYLSAADFFWTVRFHLHALAGRKDDRLTFDLQPEIARRMGFEDTDDQLGVEAFMRSYFLKAIDVGALTRLVCAKLEAEELKDPPGGRFLPADGSASESELAERGFTLHAGRLDFTDPQAPETDPVMMLRLFEKAAARHLDLHPDAVAAIGRGLRQIDNRFRTDPRAARSFFAVLMDADDPRIILRAMTEAGLLGAYIPEFGDIVARTQFNMYHRFTVDEHTLNALGLLRLLEQGKLNADHPLASKLAPEILHRRALHLAVLLHDTGKGKGDQCIEGGENARQVCPRLGLDDHETDLVAWLIENHLEMSDVAQRRDLSDPRTVLDFAEKVGTIDRLNLLTVLTVVDIRAVGPGVWNGWKAQLLRDLYQATAAVLKGGGRRDEAEARARLVERAALARNHFHEALSRIDPDFTRIWTEVLDHSYWLAFGEDDRFRHAAFARAAFERGQATSVGVRTDKRRSATEVMVLTPDRHGLFADIAGALSREGANVVGAQVTTTSDGRAFDVFYVQEQGGKPFGWSDSYIQDRLRDSVQYAAEHGLSAEDSRPVLKPLRRREAAFTVTPSVNLNLEASDDALVIEATGRDRPGLLHALAKTLSDIGLSLEAARIDGYGERAVDTFYVTEDGHKPSGDARLAGIKVQLMTVLAGAEEAVALHRAKQGLVATPASAGR